MGILYTNFNWGIIIIVIFLYKIWVVVKINLFLIMVMFWLYFPHPICECWPIDNWQFFLVFMLGPRKPCVTSNVGKHWEQCRQSSVSWGLLYFRPSEDTSERPQSQITTFPRHQKERWGITHCRLNEITLSIYWKSPISSLGRSGYEI